MAASHYDPILPTPLVEKSLKLIRITEVLQASTEDELALLKGDFQAFPEFATEHTAEYADRKKKVRVSRPLAGGPVQCQTAGGNYTMNMRMMPRHAQYPECGHHARPGFLSVSSASRL